ncbi:ankyrin repeat domain-containing protein [Achromobacter pestifer]
MTQHRGLGWMAGVLAGTALVLGQVATARLATAAPATVKASVPVAEGVKTDPTLQAPREGSPPPCDCDSPYREYKQADTPQTQALFDAVTRSDEGAFSTALAQVDHPGDYALEGVPLLHFLLMPPRSLRSKDVYWSMTPEEVARIREGYQAILPIRMRMLTALLATKPALDDVTYQSRRPPLHLALLYGTPEIMDRLLAAGAKPDQRGDDNRKPLEFLLNRDFEFAVRMTYLPRLVGRQDMTRMVLALFNAGATRPFMYVDEPADESLRRLFTDEQGRVRPAADFLAWAPMVEMTEGAAPLQALAARGSKPAYDDGLTALALAAYVGNAGAVSTLMELGPRLVSATGQGASVERDAWLDAAQAAVEGGHPEIASQLLRAGMPFAQRGPITESSELIFTKIETASRPIMNLAAKQGDVVTLQRLLSLGAPVEGDPAEQYGNTPLADAVLAHKPDAVRVLLAAGADPGLKHQGYDLKSALEIAIQEDDASMLRVLLAAMTPDALQALSRGPDHSPLAWVLRQRGKQGAAMLRQLVDAGFDLKTLDAEAIRQALENRDEATAMALIDAGVPVNPRTVAAAPSDETRDDRQGTPPLLLAVALRQNAIIEKLLAKGADPLALTPEGESALYWLIARQDGNAMLERLLRAGARLDDPRLPQAPAPYALLNAAVASGDMALVQRVSQANGQRVSDACMPQNGEFILLDKPGYFAELARAGFTGKSVACVHDAEPLPQRIVSLLLHGRQLTVARHDTVVQVLRQLKAAGMDLDAPLGKGDTALNMAITLGRADLAEALLEAGASPDSADAAGRSAAWVALETGQPGMLAMLARHDARFDTASAPAGQSFQATLSCQSAPEFGRALQAAGVAGIADCAQPVALRGAGGKAVSKSASSGGLPGHYYLRGMREVGSELLLSGDGSFDYLMSYGAVDIVARGTWRSDGRHVYLDSPPIQPYSAIADVRADTRLAQPGQLTVRVYYQDRPVKVDVAMSSAEADYAGTPRQSEGADGVSAPIAPGALKAMAVYVPLPAGARWHDVDISKIDAATRAVRVDLTLPESAATAPLHKTLALHKDGALVEASGGRELRYEKE